MRRALWVLGVVTLAVQAVLLLFGSAIERALFAASWPPLLSTTTFSLTTNALRIVTGGAGIYVASRAHRGGWVALFGVVLGLALYGPFLAAAVVPYLSVGRVVIICLTILDLALEALVPLVALAYVLRYRTARAALAPARADGG